jgi:hypothetical protein
MPNRRPATIANRAYDHLAAQFTNLIVGRSAVSPRFLAGTSGRSGAGRQVIVLCLTMSRTGWSGWQATHDANRRRERHADGDLNRCAVGWSAQRVMLSRSIRGTFPKKENVFCQPAGRRHHTQPDEVR